MKAFMYLFYEQILFILTKKYITLVYRTETGIYMHPHIGKVLRLLRIIIKTSTNIYRKDKRPSKFKQTLTAVVK